MTDEPDDIPHRKCFPRFPFIVQIISFHVQDFPSGRKARIHTVGRYFCANIIETPFKFCFFFSPNKIRNGRATTYHRQPNRFGKHRNKVRLNTYLRIKYFQPSLSMPFLFAQFDSRRAHARQCHQLRKLQSLYSQYNIQTDSQPHKR